MIHQQAGSSPRGVVAGLIVGVVGIGCCVGRAVALTGITSAAVAMDVAHSLYSEWGWAFKLAGLGFGDLRSCRLSTHAVAVGCAPWGCSGTWRWEQVLATGDPRDFRDFKVFSKFKFQTERQTGYLTLFGGSTP